MTIEEFVQVYLYVEWSKDELADMVANPSQYSAQQIEQKITSNNLFEKMINCHFFEPNDSVEDADKWE